MRKGGESGLILTALVTVAVSVAPARTAPPESEPTRSAESFYTSAQDCAECHDTMHGFWADSPHARSASSPAYLAALERAVEAAKDETAVRRSCVWCHAPTTLLTGDLELKRPISREGITCDFCHTVAGVEMGKPDHPFLLEPGDIKRGPFEYSGVTDHGTAYSPLHRFSPLLCAACHEYANANGVAVLSTYTEWKEGPYPARGVPCQDCHMAPVPGTMVKGAVDEGSLRLVNLHRLVGGSARSQLRRGLDLKIESVERRGGTAQVRVVVSNVAAGHAIPGGLSTKSLVLAVGIETADGTFEFGRERVYRRELKDERGRVLESVSDLFLKAASVGRDSRLKPRESRTERFSVPTPERARSIVARLEYRDATDPRKGPQTTLITEIRHDLSTR